MKITIFHSLFKPMCYRYQTNKANSLPKMGVSFDSKMVASCPLQLQNGRGDIFYLIVTDIVEITKLIVR